MLLNKSNHTPQFLMTCFVFETRKIHKRQFDLGTCAVITQLGDDYGITFLCVIFNYVTE
jgi:hypothetical protein